MINVFARRWETLFGNCGKVQRSMNMNTGGAHEVSILVNSQISHIQNKFSIYFGVPCWPETFFLVFRSCAVKNKKHARSTRPTKNEDVTRALHVHVIRVGIHVNWICSKLETRINLANMRISFRKLPFKYILQKLCSDSPTTHTGAHNLHRYETEKNNSELVSHLCGTKTNGNMQTSSRSKTILPAQFCGPERLAKSQVSQPASPLNRPMWRIPA